jgi:uncharacterized protein involved in exopolysaccharide biosynthesis
MVQENFKKQSNELVDIAELIRSILELKKIIFIGGAVGLFLGILIAFTTPKEYQSSSFVLLESDGGSSSLGQFGAMAGLVGVNMSQFQKSESALSSEIFPDVIQSRDFLGKIAKERFNFVTKEGKQVSLEDYYYEERPSNVVKKTLSFIISIPAIFVSWFESPVPLPSNATAVQGENQEEPAFLTLSSKEIYAIGELKKRIEIEQKGNIFRLSVSMPEPVIAAQVNALVLDKLIDYVTQYKVSKQQVNLAFVEQRIEETEKKFLESQMKLAAFKDANQGIITQRIKSREEQLQFEFNIAYNVYNSLKQEYEQTSIQLKKETPIFTMLEKAAIPLGAAKPNKPLILIFSLFLGLFMGVVLSVYKVLIKRIY